MFFDVMSCKDDRWGKSDVLSPAVETTGYKMLDVVELISKLLLKLFTIKFYLTPCISFLITGCIRMEKAAKTKETMASMEKK